MMKKKRGALRVAGLLVAYSAVGAGGEYVAGLLARDPAPGARTIRPQATAPVDIENEVERAVAFALGTGHRDCAFEAERELSLAADDAALLSIDAGSGDLVVEGRAGVEHVAATARVCATHEEDVEQLRVTIERVGGEIVLTAHYPDSRRGGSGTARIDLDVAMPLGMPVDIDDSSGSIEVFGTGDLEIDDSSGSIRVMGANGSVRVEDSSGGLEIRDVAGDVEIADGSGEIDVQDVEGSLRVRDGSGGIAAAEIESDVVIDDDGSGSIDVRNVGGNFVVEDDGSGSIRYSDVAGRVDIPADERRRGGR